MKILFKYATRNRPTWFKQTLEIYYDMLSSHKNHHFLISIDEDDLTMNNGNMKEFLDWHPNLSYKYGKNRSKIEAINADMQMVKDWDIIFVVSDDMIPKVKDFDKRIIDLMKEHFPDTDGALHFDDGYCGGDRCITLSIFGRKMYDWFGYVYHPSYLSFYCDNEFTDVVYRDEKVVFIPEVLVQHDWKGGGPDKLYKRNTKMGLPDEATYNRRKEAGFPKGRI